MENESRASEPAVEHDTRSRRDRRLDALRLARTWTVRGVAVLLGDVILAYIVLSGGLFFALALALFLLKGAPWIVFGAVLAPGWTATGLLGRRAMELPFAIWREAKPAPRGESPAARASPSS
jgi:hypothetical protein